jgi:hypothetical protein
MYTESEQQAKTRLNNLVYHAPKEGQADRYISIRAAANNLAKLINETCPPSRELSIANTKLEEVIFWANASIARNE